ncbi:MAG: hypothetical protein KAV83_08560 [Desulfobacterales bacterium]|nr:hypothetical protein [Desulfobacterales bacterium]
MTSKWRILVSVLVIILIAVAGGLYFILSQKGTDRKSEIITPSSIEEKVPQKQEATKHEEEENRKKPALPPLSENRRLLR